jgi:pimeloyl-ACP methyl ester carboxylesterase
MTEQAFRFGRARHLVGIAGLPSATSAQTGIIVLNAGLVHRIGPFRLHVAIARRLNACGYPTLRFDLSTLGDSAASDESLPRAQQVRADVADAMDLLGAQAGCTRFVLVGLCSGAENAHLVACSDPRIAGAIFLDGFAYRTPGFLLRHYLPKLANPARIWRFVHRRLRPSRQLAAPDFGMAIPPLAQVRAELADMLQRGLKLCFVYSGGNTEYFNHRRQFRECYGAVANHPGTSLEYFKAADHTYILENDRRQLVDTIERWLLRNLPQTTAGSGA